MEWGLGTRAPRPLFGLGVVALNRFGTLLFKRVTGLPEAAEIGVSRGRLAPHQRRQIVPPFHDFSPEAASNRSSGSWRDRWK